MVCILYANTDGDNPDKDYLMDGNKISVKTLDLDCDFVDVKKQLNAIVGTWLKDKGISYYCTG